MTLLKNAKTLETLKPWTWFLVESHRLGFLVHELLPTVEQELLPSFWCDPRFTHTVIGMPMPIPNI